MTEPELQPWEKAMSEALNMAMRENCDFGEIVAFVLGYVIPHPKECAVVASFLINEEVLPVLIGLEEECEESEVDPNAN